jgi:hypothetical protein
MRNLLVGHCVDILRRLEPEKVCAACGAPWERLTRRAPDNTGRPGGPGGFYARKGLPPGGQERDTASTLHAVARYAVTTIGWRPTCACHGRPEPGTAGRDTPGGTGKVDPDRWPPGVLERWPTRPAIVLDPFAGSGTTLMVAEELGRWWIGIELAEEYVPLIRERTGQVSLAHALDPCPGD